MFCPKCGTQNADAAQFCSDCGQAFQAAQASPGDYSYDKDAQENKVIAILSYFIFFIPLLTSKESKFARYHANQGLLLLIFCVAGNIILSILSAIFGLLAFVALILIPIIGLVWLVFGVAILALLIAGIINASNGKMQPLPVIGTMFTIIK